MKIYNSLTQKKEIFRPREPGKVSMYHCGPTVYDHIHIGNLRSFIMGDFIRRVFEYNDYTVTQVMNITDVGHLVSDGDTGDDKMTKALKREGKEITLENMIAVADLYSESFKSDLQAVNMLTPHHLPKASDHIQEDIDIIAELEEKGFTYITSDGVYFKTENMPDYGKLGGLNLDKETETRIGIHTEKQHQADFALWKFDTHQGWQSPWGQGFPGWHIECSGMAKKYLGDQFDIHTGGADLRSVHHNNEIAQSECASGCTPYVSYWMHGEMLNFGGAKLSKSTGGNITLRSLAERNIQALAYRYLAMQTHYRSPMNFTWDILQAAENGLKKIYREIIQLRKAADHKTGIVSKEFQRVFKEKISDDINIPQGLAVFHNMIKSDLSAADKLATAYDFDKILGLDLETYSENTLEIPDEIYTLLEKRKAARAKKNWTESDRIRDIIAVKGFKVVDTGSKQNIEKHD